MNNEHPHRRFNPLTGQWVLVSPHRTQRPWLGGQEKMARPESVSHDPKCYLCPGNTRVGGIANPSYTDVFVFPNDFPALLDQKSDTEPANLNKASRDSADDSLFQSSQVRGECRVMCFSPRHDLTLAQMDEPSILSVVNAWSEQAQELGTRYRHVQIFENKGEVMGCSNPHPHGQIWASDQLPDLVDAEDRRQRDYRNEHGKSLLQTYAEMEIEHDERVVERSEHWLAVVPYWATWPFETLVLPTTPVYRITELTSGQRSDLARTMKSLLCRYDNLFKTSFPYSMGWHGATFGDVDVSHWQLHAHFYPPLLRSAAVKKFMVGYEMMAEAQRDLTPEQAAERLRSLPAEHYLALKESQA